MAGNTGKMTAEEIEARGPRICLTMVRDGSRMIGFVIRREGPEGTIIHEMTRLRFKHLLYWTYSKSYSLSYLLRIARAYFKEQETRIQWK